MRHLYEITHNHTDDQKLLVVAEDMKRVTEVYDAKKIELISEKVITIKHREPDAYDGKETAQFKELVSFLHLQKKPFPLQRGQHPLEYFQQLRQHIKDVETVSVGYERTIKDLSEEVKKLKWILEKAIETEEPHYESDETKAGWIGEAKEAIINL